MPPAHSKPTAPWAVITAFALAIVLSALYTTWSLAQESRTARQAGQAVSRRLCATFSSLAPVTDWQITGHPDAIEQQIIRHIRVFQKTVVALSPDIGCRAARGG